MPLLYLAGAFSLNAIANILLKIGAIRGLTLSGGPLEILVSNWQFVLGMACFACNALLYFLALRALPISIAYPVMVVMSFLIINAYALAVLGEQLTTPQLVGYGLLVVGLVLIVAPAA